MIGRGIKIALWAVGIVVVAFVLAYAVLLLVAHAAHAQGQVTVTVHDPQPPRAVSRYRHEIVFPLDMNNLSMGISPTIVGGLVSKRHTGNATRVVMPPVHLMAEHCFADFGRGGSVGSGLFLSHGRYGYRRTDNDGYGDHEVRADIGMTHFMAMLSYHLTLQTGLEAYVRPMLGFRISSRHTDKAGDTGDWHANVLLHGVAGARWFFAPRWGVYLEGGYTTGALNAGLTLRW